MLFYLQFAGTSPPCCQSHTATAPLSSLKKRPEWSTNSDHFDDVLHRTTSCPSNIGVDSDIPSLSAQKCRTLELYESDVGGGSFIRWCRSSGNSVAEKFRKAWNRRSFGSLEGSGGERK